MDEPIISVTKNTDFVDTPVPTPTPSAIVTATQSQTVTETKSDPAVLSVIKTPFAYTDGVSSAFKEKTESLVSKITPEIFDSHTPDAQKAPMRDVTPSASQVSTLENTEGTGGSEASAANAALAQESRDKEAVRKEIVEIIGSIERITIKQKSLRAELVTVSEKKDSIIANKKEAEDKEAQIEKKEKEIQSQIDDALSIEEKRIHEKKRWEVEDERQRIERERWEYDQVLNQMEEDIKGIRDEIADSQETLNQAKRDREKLELQLRKLESVEKKSILQDKIKQIEALREQVITKQKELREDERSLQDSTEKHKAGDRDLLKKIQEIEEKEHAAESSAERHTFEQERWALEKERRATQGLLWDIEEEKKKIEDKRIVWSKRDEKFADALMQLKTELMNL